MNGILNLDKPAGMTSARVVANVKRLLPRGAKIGHAGTLDPFATGVLLLLIGKATKQCESLMGQAKQYEATIKLGATTATLDPESPEEPLADATRTVDSITRDEVLDVLSKMIGNVEQLPPVYSALKIDGKRAADRVRAGEVISLRPRVIRIDAIELLAFENPFARVRIDCGRGTYVRAIARDLGETLSVGGYLTELRRTRIGTFHIENASRFSELSIEHLTKRLVSA